MDEQNVNLLFVVDKIIEKLEGRKGVIDLDLDDELVNEIRLEMAETIRENYAAAALSQPAAAPSGWISANKLPPEGLDGQLVEVRFVNGEEAEDTRLVDEWEWGHIGEEETDIAFYRIAKATP